MAGVDHGIREHAVNFARCEWCTSFVRHSRKWEKAEPEGCNRFVQKCIACAPLTGFHFEADARKVHQLATSFTQGITSEQWIKMNG